MRHLPYRQRRRRRQRLPSSNFYLLLSLLLLLETVVVVVESSSSSSSSLPGGGGGEGTCSSTSSSSPSPPPPSSSSSSSSSSPSPSTTTTHSSPTPSSTQEDQISKAIRILRSKLLEDPNNAKLQHTLGLLLESSSSDEDDAAAAAEEAAQLFISSSEHPKGPAGIENLVRAARIYRERLGNINRACDLYIRALRRICDDDDADDSSINDDTNNDNNIPHDKTKGRIILQEVLQQATPLLIQQYQQRSQKYQYQLGPTAVGDNDDDDDGLQHQQKPELLLSVSELLVDQFSHVPSVHQFQGAIYRVMKQPDRAYGSYCTAVQLLEKEINANASVEEDDGNDSVHSLLLVESLLLASSAAREASESLNVQLEFLQRAEEILLEKQQRPQVPEEKDTDDKLLRLLADVYNNMGMCYKHNSGDNQQQAVRFFRKALEINPNDGHAQVQLASLLLDNTSTNDDVSSSFHSSKTLDESYVRGLFDGYSSRFEHELVNLLQYKGHIVVANCLEEYYTNSNDNDNNNRRPKSVLDLGCGTGLLGEELRGRKIFASSIERLVGIDLSPRMVELSKSRKMMTTTKNNNIGDDSSQQQQVVVDVNVYTSVYEQDVVKYLRRDNNSNSNTSSSSFDIIVASDVFIYVGDLNDALDACYNNLIGSGGLLCFTIETIDDNDGDDDDEGSDDGKMKMLSSGRFGHSQSYIRRMAKKHGFDVIEYQTIPALRMQRGEPVRGAVVLLRKKTKKKNRDTAT